MWENNRPYGHAVHEAKDSAFNVQFGQLSNQRDQNITFKRDNHIQIWYQLFMIQKKYMYKNKMHLSFAMEKSETRTIHVSNPERLLVQLLMTFFFFFLE